MTREELLSTAETVLRLNDLGDYTKPSPRLYPHQWLWDSAFVAIAWAHLDWPRAVREIDSLLAGQWTNGMLPHIRYNPSVTDYAPGPEWWPDVPVRRQGEITSGISQPPVHPTAVYTVGLLQPDEEKRVAWWRRIFEPLRDSLLYFSRERTTGSSPLIAVIHPWESGADNSPRWDFAVRDGHRPSRPYRRVDTTVVGTAERPQREDYDLYMYLVEDIAAGGYQVRARLPNMPFAVYDALFNAIWYRAAIDLNKIASVLHAEPAVSAPDLEAFRKAYHAVLWSPAAGLFRDVDVRNSSQIAVDTFAGLAAVYGGLLDADQAAAMLAAYQRRCTGCRMIPSTPPDEPGFDPARYWRGPVWVNVNWMLIRGLEALGLRQDARALSEETIELVQSEGLHEYFHSYTGEGLGGADFSWSAALLIDLLRRPVSR